MTFPFLGAINSGLLRDKGPNLSPPAEGLNKTTSAIFSNRIVYRYPLDLGKAGLKNYTVFYINVRNRDLSPYQKAQTVPVDADRSNQRRIRTEDEKVRKSTGAAVTLAAMAAGAQFGKFVGEGFSGLVGAGTGAAVVGGIEGTTGIVNKFALGDVNNTSMQVVQMKHIVALPLMSRPSATYKAGWVDMDMGMAGGMMQAGTASELMNFGGELMNALKDKNGDPTAVFQRAAENPAFQGPLASLIYKKMVSADMFGSGAGEVIEKSTARTPNPFKEQLFKSMGFRTFSFTYTFNPKSRKEALEIKNIIDLLKYYMHPGLTSENFFLTYPAEFNIKYFYDGKESNFLHKISSCALTDLAVDYGSDNDFIVFAPDSGGAEYGIPTEISLKLEFTELELLTKERVAQGF